MLLLNSIIINVPVKIGTFIFLTLLFIFFTNNKIFDLLNGLNISSTKLEWDIDLIGEIRDTIQSAFIARNLCAANEFYPALNEQEEEGI